MEAGLAVSAVPRQVSGIVIDLRPVPMSWRCPELDRDPFRHTSCVSRHGQPAALLPQSLRPALATPTRSALNGTHEKHSRRNQEPGRLASSSGHGRRAAAKAVARVRWSCQGRVPARARPVPRLRGDRPRTDPGGAQARRTRDRASNRARFTVAHRGVAATAAQHTTAFGGADSTAVTARLPTPIQAGSSSAPPIPKSGKLAGSRLRLRASSCQTAAGVAAPRQGEGAGRPSWPNTAGILRYGRRTESSAKLWYC